MYQFILSVLRSFELPMVPIQIWSQEMIPRTRAQARYLSQIMQEGPSNQQISVNNQTKPLKGNPVKKIRLEQKKKLKQGLKGDNNTVSQVTGDKDHLVIRREEEEFSLCGGGAMMKSLTAIKLKQIINKLEIVNLKEDNLIEGCFGHTTVIFRRPIIQGSYYLEFKVLEIDESERKSTVINPPSARFGICAFDYPKNSPLGQKTSIGYKTTNGTLITKGKIIEHGEVIKPGDILGMAIEFSPVYKHRKIENLWTGSSIIFLKNDLQICRTQKIYQHFYCPALSLYNYVRVQARVHYNQFVYHPQGYEPYVNIFGEQVKYANLKNKSIFGEQ